MTRKVEANQELYVSPTCTLRFGALFCALRTRFRLRFAIFPGVSGFFRLLTVITGTVIGVGVVISRITAIKLDLQLLVQSKCLLPAFQLVPRLLGLLLVGAKIKNHIGMSHDGSLRCPRHRS